MKLTYFGHSAFQLSTSGANILVDPFISGNPLAKGVVRTEDLTPDCILVTHAHGDHWGDTLSIAKRSGAVVVANFEITQYVQKHGHHAIQPLNTGGGWTFTWGRVIQTYARHSSSFPDGSYGGNSNGYIIQADDKCVYALGDTAPFAEMQWIGEEHEVDLALIPIGDCYTMGPQDSLRAIRMIRPAVTVPVHYNTFPLIEVDAARWAESVGRAGFVARVLAPGESIAL